MKVLVVGSGLIGVTVAYCLQQRGHEVVVVDRAQGPGCETSFANGGLLTPSMAEPWNAPGAWRALVESLGRSDRPMQLRARALPGLIGWGIDFLRNSRPDAFLRSAAHNLRLALYSLQVMQTLRERTGIVYGRAACGALRLFRDEVSFDHAFAAATERVAKGLGFRKLAPEEVVKQEPALAPIAERLVGAIHYDVDETGDAHAFCTQLADQARRLGAIFEFGTEIVSFETARGKVTAAVSTKERWRADRYVIAAGSYSSPLLRNIGVHVPVRPAKGYSITYDPDPSRTPLTIPVVDDHLHAAVVPMHGKLRVAGTAEFAGYDLTLRPDRVRNLVELLHEVLPREQFDPALAKPWCGLRPMSSDGMPIIGSTPLPNVFVSTGHGHLGWTMAAGSAELLVDLICKTQPAIDPMPFAFERFVTGVRSML